MQRRIRRQRRKRIRNAIIVAVIVVAAVVAAILLLKPGAGPEEEAVPAMAMVETPEAAVETPAATAVQTPSLQETVAPAAQTQAEANIESTPVETAAPAEWVEPCVSEYDYQYTDDIRSIHIDRIEENGIVYFVADVQLRDPSQFHTTLSNDTYEGNHEKLSSMASRSGAVLAINADDYGAHEYGVIIRNGVLYRTRETTRNMLIVDKNGDFTVRTDRVNEDPAALGAELVAQGVLHTFEFGPELVRNGEAVEFDPNFNVISTRDTRREPRTAIGQIGPLHYVIIVADGRQDGYSIGMTLPELQELFVRYGAHTAMNLDGGGSTELWLCGEIINRPSGGEERSLSDIIWF